MNKIILIFLIISIVLKPIYAQNNNKVAIYNAFIKGDMKAWKNIITYIEHSKPTSVSDKIELLGYYYGYIGYSLGIKETTQAEIYIEKGDKLLTELEKTNPNNANVHAFKAAFIGFKIAVSPYKAPFIGNSSIESVKKALSLDKNNIQANIEQANILYYAPFVFGGDKDKAQEYYQKAITLFEENPKGNKQNWLYLSLLTQIGQMQTSEEKYNEAKKTYQKILKIEPNYNYVKNELLPALEKKI